MFVTVDAYDQVCEIGKEVKDYKEWFYQIRHLVFLFKLEVACI